MILNSSFFRKGLNELVNFDDGDESARSECEEFSIFKHTQKNLNSIVWLSKNSA